MAIIVIFFCDSFALEEQSDADVMDVAGGRCAAVQWTGDRLSLLSHYFTCVPF